MVQQLVVDEQQGAAKTDTAADGDTERIPEVPEENEIERIRRVEGVGHAVRKGRGVVRPSRTELQRLNGKYPRKTLCAVYKVAHGTLLGWLAQDSLNPKPAPRKVTKPSRGSRGAVRKVEPSPTPTAIKAAFGAVRDLLVAEVVKKEDDLTAARGRLARYDEMSGILNELGIVLAPAE